MHKFEINISSISILINLLLKKHTNKLQFLHLQSCSESSLRSYLNSVPHVWLLCNEYGNNIFLSIYENNTHFPIRHLQNEHAFYNEKLDFTRDFLQKLVLKVEMNRWLIHLMQYRTYMVCYIYPPNGSPHV